MDLSKKVGYIKGLMAGLKIDDSTPEGQVLNAMAELLEEMAEEIEINAEIIDTICECIDEGEDFECDCCDDCDDVKAQEFDEDPFADDEVMSEDELKELDRISNELEEQYATEQEIDADKAPTNDEPFTAENQDAGVIIENQIPSNNEFMKGEHEMPESTAPDDVSYECPCPVCGRTFPLTADQVKAGSASCPLCGAYLEFEF